VVHGVAAHARPTLGDRDRALAALTLDTLPSFRHRPRRLITNRCLSLGITHLGGRPTTRSEQPPTCRDRNWIAVIGPGTYGRGAALYVAQAGSTVPEPRREPIQVPPERLQDGT
jgi:hypothetical protein